MILSIFDSMFANGNQQPFLTMSAFRSLCFLLCAVLLCLVACNSRSDLQRQAGTPSSCDTGLLSRYHQLVDEHNDTQLSATIIKFYNNTPAGCRNLIVNKVLGDLFNFAYTSRVSDTATIGFVSLLAEERTLTEPNRIKSLFSAASIYLFVQREPEPALVYLDKAKKKEQFFDDSLSKSYNALMAQVMLLQSDLKEAARYYVKTIALCEKIKDSNALAGTYSNFGLIYNKMGQYQKSIEMQQRATAFFERTGNLRSAMIAYQGIAVNYANMSKYDSALIYYNRVLEILKEGARNESTEFDVIISIAGIYTGKNMYDSARYYYDKAKILLGDNSRSLMEKTYIMASTPAYAQVRDVTAEIEKIKAFIPEFKANNDLFNTRNGYQVLFHTYYVQNKYKEAYEYYKKWDSAGNVLAEEENRKYIAELETKYETEKKELKIEVQKREIRQKNMLNLILLVLLALGALATAFIVTRIKFRRNKKEAKLQQNYTRQLLENTEEERERIARDLHDGVSQELMLLKHQVNSNHESTSEKIDTIINEIRMISRDLHPVMLDKIGLKPSIEHTCNQMMEANQLFITAEIEYNNSLDRGKELQLFRIIQECLNNVAKYAGAHAAKVTLSEKEHYILLQIEDNGKGFDVDAALNSKNAFGLHSIIQRSRSLQGKAEFSSSNNGTIIKIEVPKNK